MNRLRLAEILLPLVAARAWSPWQPAPRLGPRPSSQRQRSAGSRPVRPDRRYEERRLFDDVQ
jgi:hypothetical protein